MDEHIYSKKDSMKLNDPPATKSGQRFKKYGMFDALGYNVTEVEHPNQRIYYNRKSEMKKEKNKLLVIRTKNSLIV